MPYSKVKDSLIEATGRKDFELSSKAWILERVINWGQRMLDSMQTTHKSSALKVVQISQGDFIHYVQDLRVLEDVWTADDDGKVQLTAKTLQWMRDNYSYEVSALDQGRPSYFCEAIVGLAPSQYNKKASDFSGTLYDVDEIFFYEDAGSTTQHHTRTGVLTLPPADASYTMRIVGKFFSRWIGSDNDKTYWTEMHEDLLVLAAAYKVETILHRNTEGARDYLAAIQVGLRNIDHDLAESSAPMTRSMEMKG